MIHMGSTLFLNLLLILKWETTVYGYLEQAQPGLILEAKQGLAWLVLGGETT